MLSVSRGLFVSQIDPKGGTTRLTDVQSMSGGTRHSKSLEDLEMAIDRSFFGIPFAFFTTQGELVLLDPEAKRLAADFRIALTELRRICLSLTNQHRGSTFDRPSTEISLRRGNRSVRIKFLLEELYYREEHFHVLLIVGPGVFSPFGLSSREIEIVMAIRDGLSNREIGDTLYISLDTVKRHITNILRKTDSRNRTELLYNLKQHLLSL